MNTDIRAIHEKLMLMSEATKLMREAEQRESKLHGVKSLKRVDLCPTLR
jgi:hypothetical protein